MSSIMSLCCRAFVVPPFCLRFCLCTVFPSKVEASVGTKCVP